MGGCLIYMMNRTDILRRLIEIRRVIYRKEEILNSTSSLEDIKTKKNIDKLIKDVIGDFLNPKDSEAVDKIILKTICEEIDIDMALVAISEIVQEYYSTGNRISINKTGKKHEEDELATAYYERGYR